MGSSNRFEESDFVNMGFSLHYIQIFTS